jgi:hypothetical protein
MFYEYGTFHLPKEALSSGRLLLPIVQSFIPVAVGLFTTWYLASRGDRLSLGARAMNERDHLVQTDRHIAECKARIERQRELIRQTGERGQATLWARETLKTWEASLRVFAAHRQLIVDRLKDVER